MFPAERGDLRVENKVAASVGLLDSCPEQFHERWTGAKDQAARGSEEPVQELEGLCQGGRRMEDARMRDDAEELGNTEERQRP